MSNSSSSVGPDRTRVRFLEIALIFAVFFVAGGAPVPHVNETHYLAKAKQYWQPEWCEGDLFLESGKAHVTFYWTVGVLTKWLELPIVAWIGRLVAWLMLAFAWERLSHSATAAPFRGLLSAMLLVALIDWTNFAGEWVIGGVEGKCFAYAFVFWGLAELNANRWQRVWPLLGVASAFHVLVGGWSVIAAGLVWLSAAKADRPPVRSMLLPLILGGILALPGVLPALQLTIAVSPEEVSEANQIYVFDRLPHHLAPLTLKTSELSKKALRFSALLLGFAWLRFFCTRIGSRSKESSSRAVDLLMRFALAALLISVTGLAWELATASHPALSAKLLKFYLFRLADIAVPVATAVGIVWLTEQLFQAKSQWGILLLLASIALPSLHLVDLSRSRLENPLPPAERRLRDPTAFREACHWARAHTSKDALFLVPRGAQAFKWHAGRSDLVTWKDVPQNARDLIVWRDRHDDVWPRFDAQGNRIPILSLAKQGTQRIRELAERYELDYLLTQEYPPLSLPVAYANDTYTIYKTSGKTTKTR